MYVRARTAVAGRWGATHGRRLGARMLARVRRGLAPDKDDVVRTGAARPGKAVGRALAVAVAVALLMIGTPSPAHGATRTWTGLGANNNWNTAANWSGLAVPGVNDTAVFDGTSAKNANLNVNVNLGGATGGLTITAAYTGSITQLPNVTLTVGTVGFSQDGGTFTGGGTGAITVNGPLTLTGGTFSGAGTGAMTVNGGFSQSGGSFTGGTGTRTVNGAFSLTGGSFTSTSGTWTVTGNFTQSGGTFDPNGGVLRFAGGAATIDVAGSATYGNVVFAAGTKTIAAGNTVIVTGLLTMSGSVVNTGTIAARGPINQAATAGAGTGTVRIDGTLDQTFTGSATAVPGAGALPNLVIDKPSGTLDLVGTIRTGRNWTYTSGAVDAGTSLVVLTGGTLSGAMPFFDLDLRGGTITGVATDTATVDGTLNLVSGAFNIGTIAARGPINQAATAGAGTGTVRIDGTLDQTFTGSATAVPGAGALPNLVIDKPSGTLDLVGTIRTGRNWTYTSGAVDAGTSLVVLTGGTLSGAMPFFDLDLRGGTITGVATDTATVDGTLNLVSGAFNIGTLAARGPINQAATAGAGTGTVRIDGTLDQTFTGSATAVPGAGALPNLVIDKPSGTLDLVGTIRTGRNWTYTSGAVDAGYQPGRPDRRHAELQRDVIHGPDGHQRHRHARQRPDRRSRPDDQWRHPRYRGHRQRPDRRRPGPAGGWDPARPGEHDQRRRRPDDQWHVHRGHQSRGAGRLGRSDDRRDRDARVLRPDHR